MKEGHLTASLYGDIWCPFSFEADLANRDLIRIAIVDIDQVGV